MLDGQFHVGTVTGAGDFWLDASVGHKDQFRFRAVVSCPVRNGLGLGFRVAFEGNPSAQG